MSCAPKVAEQPLTSSGTSGYAFTHIPRGLPQALTACTCRALRLLASPGKSGSVFFLSDDDRFMIKTMKHEEMRLLLELMPQYYSHVESNHNTLLTRFHAVHRVKPLGGQKVSLVGG